jgi:micrococcal nuclease
MTRVKLVLLPLIALLLLFPLISVAKEPVRTEEGIVKKVADGDTVTVMTNEGTKLKVRLYGIDAPETKKMNHKTGVVSKPGQPYGEEAYRALENKLLGKRVKVVIMDVDRYRRMVGILYLGGGQHRHQPRNGTGGLCVGLQGVFEGTLCLGVYRRRKRSEG